MATCRKRVWAVVLAAAFVGAGCFKPNIAEGGFLCGDGGACPEGFRCAADGTCRKGPPPVCQDAAPHIQPLCAVDGGLGTECDPICQSNCACGRCSIKAAALTCIPIGGEKKHGDVCNPDAGADECAPGNICQSDCNNAVARCVRFCGSDRYTDPTVCGGQRCDNAVRDPITGANTTAIACAPPVAACNPVVDSNDCGNPALGCYVSNTGGVPVCDCKGMGQAGDPCVIYNSCIPGFRCVTTTAGGTTCHKTCRRNGNDCPNGGCTPIGGGEFGYCP